VSIAGSLLLVVLGSLSASAQSATDAPRAAPADHPLKIPALLWVGTVAADQITTYRFASLYGDLIHEENPLIRGLDRRPALMVAAGTAIDATTGWLAYGLLGRRHPRLARMAFYSAAAYRGYLAAHNVHMMRQADDLRSGSAFSRAGQ
jgi:hypothetical protein